jgi:hypothetical protein
MNTVNENETTTKKAICLSIERDDNKTKLLNKTHNSPSRHDVVLVLDHGRKN